ncbi:nuclear RNA export factor 2 isoform X1 [Oryctolagus cuniculus]|uniref:nuclear RNA export factor 2 isoform X1 n=1 Tax=Oryctolagus cuniculus TaxID=9986 RepID=UPI002230CC68|nr:nuclear RNA export factor 2 isoform X1 [Oryctolagus cuniculus]
MFCCAFWRSTKHSSQKTATTNMSFTQRKSGANQREERSGSSSVHEGRKRSWGSFQGNFSGRNLLYEHSRHEHLRSHRHDDDGTVAMRNVHQEPQLRRTPNNMQYSKRRLKYNHDHVDAYGSKKCPEGEMEDGTVSCWFKVTVPNGRKYNKKWLLSSIQSESTVHFTPVDFHYINNQARFFVQYSDTASALKNVSHKICDDENRKIPIFVNRSSVPYSVKNKLKPEEMEQLKLTLNKRYDASRQALDLQNLRFDPDLVGHDIDMILNRRQCMDATLKIIEGNFPELLSLNLCNNKLYQLDGLCDIIENAPKVKILNLSNNELKTACELNKLKELNLEELWLEGNPLWRTFPNHSAYVSAMQDCFPNLLRLDGREIASPVVIDVGAPKLVKLSKEIPKGTEMLKSLVLQFLQEYYFIYDYGDRRGLLGTYHDKACFSLTMPFNSMDPVPSGLFVYLQNSRNIKNVTDPHLRRQLLKHTSRDIVDALSVLPRTKHDFSSFSIDMWFHTETMLCFSVNGVFKEENGSPDSVFAFTRTFIAIPGSTSSLCITNDQLFVKNVSSSMLQCTSSIPGATPSSSCTPVLSQLQLQMVQSFSTQSGMKIEWSQKCLEENEWNYTRAAQAFINLQTQGTIPKEAFQQSV